MPIIPSLKKESRAEEKLFAFSYITNFRPASDTQDPVSNFFLKRLRIAILKQKFGGRLLLKRTEEKDFILGDIGSKVGR